jgi:hypothetical protein
MARWIAFRAAKSDNGSIIASLHSEKRSAIELFAGRQRRHDSVHTTPFPNILSANQTT